MNTQERINLIMSMLVADETSTDDKECLSCDKLPVCEELGRIIEQDLLIDLLAKRMGIDLSDADKDINSIFGLPESDLIPKSGDVLFQNRDKPSTLYLPAIKSKGWLN